MISLSCPPRAARLIQSRNALTGDHGTYRLRWVNSSAFAAPFRRAAPTTRPGGKVSTRQSRPLDAALGDFRVGSRRFREIWRGLRYDARHDDQGRVDDEAR